MAVNMHAPKPINWWIWGGGAVAAVVVIAALGFGFDWSGTGNTGEVIPAIEQTAPVTE
jgi:uncharacterized membrane protein YdcZ (DUF606 family)